MILQNSFGNLVTKLSVFKQQNEMVRHLRLQLEVGTALNKLDRKQIAGTRSDGNALCSTHLGFSKV